MGVHTGRPEPVQEGIGGENTEKCLGDQDGVLRGSEDRATTWGFTPAFLAAMTVSS